MVCQLLMGLKSPGKRDRAIIIIIDLTFEFRRFEHLRIGQAEITPCDGNTSLQAANKDILINARAVTNGISIKEDIPCNRLPLYATKEIPAEFFGRDEEFRATDRGADKRRAVIRWQITPQTRH